MNVEDVREAARLLDGVALRTPVTRPEGLAARLGSRVALKNEHLQRTGSFKIRGAYVKISRLSAEERARGVVAASAGNHAQGIAWAAARLSVRATVVMPAHASLPKVEATRRAGAEVVLEGDGFDGALVHARGLAEERRAVLVHPFDDRDVVAGQGTLGLEICEDVTDLDRVVVPVGGGGLAGGIATAVKALRPEVAVVGIRPASAPATIADGAGVKSLGDVTAPIIERLVDDMAEVDEEAISEAILLHLEETKQVVEGAGALPLAGVLAGVVPVRGHTLLVVSGGNIDPGLLMRVIRHGLSAAGRYLFVRILLPDRPGELHRVLALVADRAANVVSVVHHRVGLTLPVDEVGVELTLETRDRAHADAVLEALERGGYRPTL